MTTTTLRHLQPRDLTSRLGVTRKHAYLLQDKGAVMSGNVRPGMGKSRQYSPQEALALWVACQLLPRGFSMVQCGAAAQWVLGIRWYDIQHQVADGRHLILAVGDALPPPGRLLSPGEVFYNDFLPLSEIAALPCPLGIVDIRPALTKIRQFLADSENPGSSSRLTGSGEAAA